MAASAIQGALQQNEAMILLKGIIVFETYYPYLLTLLQYKVHQFELYEHLQQRLADLGPSFFCSFSNLDHSSACSSNTILHF